MKDPQEAISTDGLQKILLKTKPDDIPAYYEAHKDDLIRGDRPFMDYMNARIKEKGLSKQQVFLAADLPEKYGYKLLDEDDAPGFFVEHYIKDLTLAAEELADRGKDFPILDEVLSMYRELAEDGDGRLGTQALIKVYEKKD